MNLLQAFLHDVHPQVEHQVEHMLSQATLTLLQLEALTQLMAVDGQLSSQLSDLHVRMMQEVGLGLEIRLATMGHSLVEYLVITVVVETQSVSP